MNSTEVVIVGGGLAGLTAAIHLSRLGRQVLVFERNEFPKHKVCGEYISNEVIPYFNWLGINPEELVPAKITKLVFSSTNGRTLQAELPLGGFGVSRHALDYFLYQKAVSNGCKFIHETIETIEFTGEIFSVTSAVGLKYNAQIVLGAFGKRSSLDQKMQRRFIMKKSPWLAVKGHYDGIFPDDLVGLHNFPGGYCGISKVEGNSVNICYLADYRTFKKYRNLKEYEAEVVVKNPNLKKLFETMTLTFEKQLTISQISFAKKAAVENHILMIGDTAGLIHPLCGNGMAMAVHSAKIAAELTAAYFKKSLSRKQLETQYAKEWNRNFKRRLRTGRILSSVLQKPKLADALIRMLGLFPFLLPMLINKTHGKPITPC